MRFKTRFRAGICTGTGAATGTSKLGRQTGEWFRDNFEQIERAVEKRKAELKRAKEKQDSASSEEAQSSGSNRNKPSPYVVPDKVTLKRNPD